jgi:RNA polymerase sigma factor (sigma-70 family)
VIGQVDRLFRQGTLTASSDAQLLERYLTARDEAAFEALVDLHGPMVLGLCRRMLRDPRDIEDAFQATFLVLIRRAPRIQDRRLLANWLYGVAYRVAFRARGDLLRRREREASLADIEVPAAEEPQRDEVAPHLDQELRRLPAKYRDLLVLCYLRGLTHDQAAEHLHCPVGTVRSRLARGRNLLKRRLAARGLAGAALLDAPALPAPGLPASLLRGTVETTGEFLKAKALASCGARALAEGVLTNMAGSRLRSIVLSTIALLLSTGAVVAVAWQYARSSRKSAGASASPSLSSPRAPGPEQIALVPAPKAKPGDRLRIEVLEALPGRPISGIRIVRPDGTISLGFYGDLEVAGLDRNEIKAKLVNHLRKYLTDEFLGLIEFDEQLPLVPKFTKDAQGREVLQRIKPADTDRVFVDDSVDQATSLENMNERLDKLEESIRQLVSRLDGSGPTRTDAKKSDVGKDPSPAPTRAERPGSEEAKPEQTPQGNAGVDASPFQAGFPSWHDLADLLRTQRKFLDEQEGLAKLGKAEPTAVAKARSAFEHSKQLIPAMIQQAREAVEEASKQLNAAIAEESSPQGRRAKESSRLEAARLRLEEHRRLLKEGKILEEALRDAEGDYQTLARHSDELDPPVGKRACELHLEIARSELEFAEMLEKKYLGAPPKAPLKAAKPQ